MRSNQPSIVGVNAVPITPSARSIGSVCRSWIPTPAAVPELGKGPRANDGLVRQRDHGGGIVEEPNRRRVHQLARFWIPVVVLPLYPLTGYLGLLVSLEEHRVLFQKLDVIGAVLREVDSRAADEEYGNGGEQCDTAEGMVELNMAYSKTSCAFSFMAWNQVH
jgi:hypothetical protein